MYGATLPRSGTLLLPSLFGASFAEPPLDEHAHLAAWELHHEQQLQAVRAFNADLPIMGREGRASTLVPNDDDPVADEDEHTEDEDEGATEEEEIDDEDLAGETEEEFAATEEEDEPEY
jgi:hypothetical protein